MRFLHCCVLRFVVSLTLLAPLAIQLGRRLAVEPAHGQPMVMARFSHLTRSHAVYLALDCLCHGIRPRLRRFRGNEWCWSNTSVRRTRVLGWTLWWSNLVNDQLDIIIRSLAIVYSKSVVEKKTSVM